MNRKLPIGIQSFESIRKDGYVYVDKTEYVWRLAHEGKSYFLSRPRRFGKSYFLSRPRRFGKSYFLSRPRRFGKSLLVSTMRAYFEGRRELFAGLAIEKLEEETAREEGREPWVAHPVFHFSFNGADYTREEGLPSKLDELLRGLEDVWGGDWAALPAGSRLQRLIGLAHKKSGHRVAILVDEYDKPLLDAMDDVALEERNRTALKAFFSVLKDADEHLKFAFLTGVTKFSKVSIFSDLNQLSDVSLERDYAGVCGITESELAGAFAPEIVTMAGTLGTDAGGCLDTLRAWYDGYCFHPDGPGAESDRDGRCVYNPFSLLNALQKRRLGSWWFESGTPTFLVRRMRDVELDPRRLTDGTIYATERRLSDYRADDPDPIPLMYQAGYLTIRSADTTLGDYTLAVPNGEVRDGLVESLLPAWAPGYSELRGTDVYTLRRLVEAGDTQGIRDVLAALFASIPYTRADDPFENYFQVVIWLVFTLLGRYVHTEVRQAGGRADVIVEARSHVYVMDLKRDGTAAEAVAQIGERGYATPYAADPRELHLIGAAFDSGTRQLSDWQET